jgi:hypothetical protein
MIDMDVVMKKATVNAVGRQQAQNQENNWNRGSGETMGYQCNENSRVFKRSAPIMQYDPTPRRPSFLSLFVIVSDVTFEIINMTAIKVNRPSYLLLAMRG